MNGSGEKRNSRVIGFTERGWETWYFRAHVTQLPRYHLYHDQQIAYNTTTANIATSSSFKCNFSWQAWTKIIQNPLLTQISIHWLFLSMPFGNAARFVMGHWGELYYHCKWYLNLPFSEIDPFDLPVELHQDERTPLITAVDIAVDIPRATCICVSGLTNVCVHSKRPRPQYAN